MSFGPKARRPRLAITLGDPRGIGPEVTAAALAGLATGGESEAGDGSGAGDGIDAVLTGPRGLPDIEAVLIGPSGLPDIEGLLQGIGGPQPADATGPHSAGMTGRQSAGAAERRSAGGAAAGGAGGRPEVRLEALGAWESGGGERRAGELSVRAIRRAVALAQVGEVDGIVTAPISKAAMRRAGHPWPGHTECLQELTGAGEVTMMMAAETTPLGGSLRLALLTAHVALREVPVVLDVGLFVRRTALAVGALRRWWGIARPRIAFAGLNPHAGEGGLFGREEIDVFAPAIERLTADPEVGPHSEVLGIFPGDTVFLKALAREADLIVTPYHDVGLAVLKTIAMNRGVNVTAGLPFPRTSPDHGTALDIAGRGIADPGAMRAAIDLCARFALSSPAAAAAP